MTITPLITEAQINEKVNELAARIRKDYKDKVPILIGCLTGCFVFMADLVRRLGIPIECDFIKLSSYEDRMTSGELQFHLDNHLPIEGRDVIIVEDIADTGASLAFNREWLAAKKPKSLKTCVLVYKESPRALLPKDDIDYLGFVIPDVFIVGYGIDWAQKYRELPYIGAVER